MYYVYLLRCADDSLYCGITTNLERRLNEHNSDSGRGAKYLRAKRPVAIVYSEPQPSRGAALKREAVIKSWQKEQKEKLVAHVLPYYQQEKPWTCSLANLRMVLASQQLRIAESDLEKEIASIQKRRSKNVTNADIAQLARKHSMNCSLVTPTYNTFDAFTPGRNLFQVSIRTNRLYAKGRGYHSLLIYNISGDELEYHDPLFGQSLRVSRKMLLTATKTTGVGILYTAEFIIAV